MTPLGARMRALRRERGVSLKEMAAALNVSSAYLSALEHGRRGKPTGFMLHRIIAYFNVIWDEAEELQRLAENSDPKATINTAGMPLEATALTNWLAHNIADLSAEDLKALREDAIRRAAHNRKAAREH
ncbi:transcriptional regulator [Devosia pacifica]|uniref:Transcriptional regulator n=1 Tax=Devosia pacifica TaxID=1335967 RepID=A0A918S3V1_9HYPH|nr:helix-turn-helix transcriptional regulator [Devosia pacifica]GHA23327.1 transcriptional regulator [Devosia pacifica]